MLFVAVQVFFYGYFYFNAGLFRGSMLFDYVGEKAFPELVVYDYGGSAFGHFI